jgi:DNA (cytosine-5)-methyltransferase 1
MCEEEIRFIDLFGGIGGFRYGLEKASDRYKCVWYCDNDKYAVQVYNKNYNEKWEATDIREIPALCIPDFDLLCAGFPCQAFSVAGKRRGFEDTRGTLFFEIARILEAKRPKAFILENVKGLLSHQRGKTFRIILETLDELGYEVEWMVLNSKFFGVPQSRERVFIIGHLTGTSGGEILPFREDAGQIQGVSGKTKDLIIHNIHKGFKEDNPRVFENYTPTIRTPKGGGHIPSVARKIIAMRAYPRTGTKEQDGDRIQNIEPQKEDCSNALTNIQKDNLLGDYDKLRRLTPVECERLQGYPDGWTSKGIDDNKIVEISDTQRYKMCGNAVTTNVINAIGSRLINYI